MGLVSFLLRVLFLFLFYRLPVALLLLIASPTPCLVQVLNAAMVQTEPQPRVLAARTARGRVSDSPAGGRGEAVISSDLWSEEDS